MELLAHTSTIHTSATWLMDNTEWDLMAVYYEGIDRFAHAFMHFHPPRMEHVPEERFERYRHVMEVCYRFHDMMLAATLKLAGPDTTVVLLSDHGYHFDHLRPPGPVSESDPVAWHHPLGVLAMSGPGIRQGQTLLGASLLDVAPTVLNLLGLPFGLDMDGRPLVAALESAVEQKHVLSWELLDGDDGRVSPEAPADEAVDPEAEREAMRQLAELGYIEPLAENAAEQVAAIRRTNALCLIQSRLEAGDAAAAEAELVGLLEERPADTTALQLLAGCLLGRGDAEAAETRVRELEEHGADAPAVALLRARLLAARGEHEEALALLDGIDTPAEARASFDLEWARLQLAAGRVDEADAGYRRVLTTDPDQPFALDGLAAVALERGDPAAAAEHCLAVLQRVYFLPRTHLRLGVALWKLGDRDGAIQATRVARQQAPASGPIRHQLVSFLREAGRGDEAEAEERAPRSSFDALVRADLAEQRRRAPGTGAAAEGPEPSAGEVVVVSGLPRSGTSLMMQLLEAAGVPLFTDGKRAADEHNPRGYHEHAGVMRLASDPGVLRGAEGHAVKVVHALVEHLPPGPRYRVVWMQRDLGEVLGSQARMAGRLAGDASAQRNRDALGRVFTRQAERALRILEERRDVDLHVVEHAELVADPLPVLARLVGRLGLDADPAELSRVVDPSLHRERAGPPDIDPA